MIIVTVIALCFSVLFVVLLISNPSILHNMMLRFAKLCFYISDTQAKRLKAIMMAAAELAALRLSDFSSTNHQRGFEIDGGNRVFQLLDKNGDGRISLEELTEVVEELGAEREDADELMQLLDANSDGSLSSDEFDQFQRQVMFLSRLHHTRLCIEIVLVFVGPSISCCGNSSNYTSI